MIKSFVNLAFIRERKIRILKAPIKDFAASGQAKLKAAI